jgi:hypothetical protein
MASNRKRDQGSSRTVASVEEEEEEKVPQVVGLQWFKLD